MELIFIDNCSDDKSVSIAEQYKVDKIFSFEKKTEYRGKLYNKGIELSIGEYIFFLHSDTIVEDGLISDLLYIISFNYFDWINIYQRYLDGNLYGNNHIGIDEKMYDLFYRKIFYWNSNVNKRLECSEASFVVKNEFIKKYYFNELLKSSFFEYIPFLEHSIKIHDFKEKTVYHYFLEMHDKIKNYDHDYSFFLTKFFPKLYQYFRTIIHSKLYVDYGNDFNENDAIVLSIIKNENILNGFAIVNNKKTVNKVRFDPIEDFLCKCKIYNILTNDGNKSIERSNASLQKDGWDYFFTHDPLYIIEGTFNGVEWIKIEFELEMLTQEDITNFISKVQDELNQTKNELNQIQDELNHIKRSRTWRWGNIIADLLRFIVPPNTTRRKVIKKILFIK